MSAGNPFDPTGYKLSIKTQNEFDPCSLGAEGIRELLSYCREQIRLRREAVRLGYLQSVDDPSSEFIPIIEAAPDSVGAMLAVMENCRDCALQLLPGHSSGFFDRHGKIPCDGSGGSFAGFFRVPSSFTADAVATDEWLGRFPVLIADGLYDQADADRLLNPPNFADGYISMRAYAGAVGRWGNSFFKLINLMRFIHPKMSFEIPFSQCSSGAADCDFSMSFTSLQLTQPVPNRPVDIIMDIRGALTCETREASDTAGCA